MIENMNEKLAIAIRINDALVAAGAGTLHLDLRNGRELYRVGAYSGFQGIGADVSVTLEGYTDASTNEAAAIEREAVVARLLEVAPYLNIDRKNGNMGLYATVDGYKVEIKAGDGACTRIQTGTRIVPARPAEPEREEPIFEVICSDPITALALA